jgi:hypothetical protein
MAGPDFTFKAFCEIIRDKGFKRSPYPILIVLPSQLRLTADQEEAVADQLNESLGHMIARGLMFAGGTARDPQFNPASLRHKVLIMGAQGTLRPFVGLFVADMARGGLGVRVTDVKDASPAAKAGLIKDDWITRINDRKIDDKTALKKQLSTFHLGDEFTITKENLTEARVVVGGAVDPTDAAHASALSELIYFNYNKPDRAARQAKHAREAAQAHADGAATPAPGDDFAPWETEVVSSAALASATKPQEHFMLVQPAPVPANATPADEARFEREMLAAEHVGAQLIDSNATMAARRWARGTFLVNGQCGFVLKESIESSRSRSAVWRFRVLSWPHEIPTTARVTAASARIFGRAEAESKVTIRQVAQGSASVAGGSEDDGAMVIMSVRATEHSLLVLTVQFDDGRTTLEAVLAAHMLRTGLRAVPFKHFTATPHNCNVLCVVELADSVE